MKLLRELSTPELMSFFQYLSLMVKDAVEKKDFEQCSDLEPYLTEVNELMQKRISEVAFQHIHLISGRPKTKNLFP
jgi:hypothetical protein